MKSFIDKIMNFLNSIDISPSLVGQSDYERDKDMQRLTRKKRTQRNRKNTKKSSK